MLKTRAWFVIGPSGAGKTTLGQALARRLEAPFLEGDAFHPQANIEKMRAGAPLDDEDRRPWLAALASAVRETKAAEVVVACSALKRAYRDLLRAITGDGVATVFLSPPVDPQVLARRVENRPGHFMAATLLPSQLETFEPPLDEPDAVMLPAGSAEAMVDVALGAVIPVWRSQDRAP